MSEMMRISARSTPKSAAGELALSSPRFLSLGPLRERCDLLESLLGSRAAAVNLKKEDSDRYEFLHPVAKFKLFPAAPASQRTGRLDQGRDRPPYPSSD